MKSELNFTINIAQPCHQNWAEMTSQQQGRFCTHCQKTVIDISDWDDVALVRFYQQQSDPVCVRMLSTQMGRSITIPPGKSSVPKYPYAAVVGMGLLILSQGKAFAQAPLKQAVQQVDSAKTGNPLFFKSRDSVLLKGVVINETKNEIAHIPLALMNKEEVLSSFVSDEEGCFSIWASLADVSAGNLQIRLMDNRYLHFSVSITEDFINRTEPLKLIIRPLDLVIINPQQIHVMGTSIAMDINKYKWHKTIWSKKYKKPKKK